MTSIRNDTRRATSAAPAQPAVTVAPFVLLRVASVPITRLTELAPRRTTHVTSRLAEDKACLDRAATAVAADLRLAVPRLADRVSRHLMLQVARDVHNRRLPHHGTAAQVLVVLQPEPRTRLAEWLRAAGEFDTAISQAENLLAQEVRLLRTRLRAACRDPWLNRAIGLSSPDLTVALSREEASGPRRSHRLDRSLMRYLTRACAKTSPFGTFLHVAVVTLDSGTAPDAPHITGSPRATVTLNRGLLARLQQAANALSIIGDDQMLAVNSSIRRLGIGRIEALVTDPIVLIGRPWRRMRVARFRLPAALATRLAEGPARVDVGTLNRTLAGLGLGQTDTRQLILRLMWAGLLSPLPTVDAFEPDAARAVIRWGDTVPHHRSIVASAVRAMTAEASELVDEHGPRRLSRMEEIARLEREVSDDLGRPLHAPYRNLVFEQTRVSVIGHFGGGLTGALEDLGRFLGTHLAVRPVYVELVDRFVRRYGEAGRCRDLVGFFVEEGPALVQWATESMRETAVRAVPARTGERVGVTAFVQPIAADAQSLVRGDVSLVVNRVYEGLGWLAARYSAGQDEDAGRLAIELRHWLDRAFFPREPVDLVICGDCNDLQAHARVTRRVLGWPGEPLRLDRARILGADHLVLTHDPATGLLDLTDTDGTPLALVYLGAVLPLPTWGVSYALTVLAQPHAVRRPRSGPPPSPATDVVFSPRRTEGRLVVTRATWWVTTRHLRERWFQHQGARRLIDVTRDRARSCMPEILFASAVGRAGSSERARYPTGKPLPVDTTNPISLEILERMSAGEGWVALVEALPAMDGHWARIDGRMHASELQIELVTSAAGPGQTTGDFGS